MKIITSTGYGDSGSSAVTDFLREFDSIKSFNSEWEATFLHMPDGLADLENAILEGHRLKVDSAFATFLNLCKTLSFKNFYNTVFHGKFYDISLDFVEKVASVKWDGMYEDRLPSFFKSLNKKETSLLHYAESFYNASKTEKLDVFEGDDWLPSYTPYSNMYYATDIHYFYECAKEYIKNLVNEITTEHENLYLDQLLPPISVKKYLNYLPYPAKVFIVDRDPRDLFLVENLYNGSRYIPFKDVDVFIKWYRLTRTKAKEESLPQNKYFCMLDELVYDYENQSERIINFVGLEKQSHIKRFAYFDPKKSAKNTLLYKKYDNYKTEIQKIERELPEFLFEPSSDILKDFETSNVRHFNIPIKEILEQCDEIQRNGIQHGKLKLAFHSTQFYIVVKSFKSRKNLFKRIKGFIKISIGFIIFIPDFIIKLLKLIFFSR